MSKNGELVNFFVVTNLISEGKGAQGTNYRAMGIKRGHCFKIRVICLFYIPGKTVSREEDFKK